MMNQSNNTIQPFSYVGGKVRIQNWIISHFPKNYIDLHYVEPFFGGGAVFFKKKQSLLESINDIDQNLISLWRVFQTRRGVRDLIRFMNTFIWSEKLWKESRDTVRQPFPADPDYEDILKRAKAILYYMSTSFSNCPSSWGFLRRSGSANLKKPHRKKMLFMDIHNRLKGVQIFDRCAFRVIENTDSPDTLFYLDPPYPKTGQKYFHKFKEKELEKMFSVLSKIKGRFLLSCYERNLPEKMNKKWHVHKTNKRLTMNTQNLNDKIVSEYLITNYKTKTESQGILFSS